MMNSGFDANACDFASIKADGFVNGHLTLTGLLNKDDYRGISACEWSC
jgi:hypothetical protein